MGVSPNKSYQNPSKTFVFHVPNHLYISNNFLPGDPGDEKFVTERTIPKRCNVGHVNLLSQWLTF